MHSARPLHAARARDAAARPLGRCLRYCLTGGGGGEAAWRRLLPLQRQSNQRGAQAARRVPSAIRAPAACLALRRRLGCAVAPGVAAFRLPHCARGALRRACGVTTLAEWRAPRCPAAEYKLVAKKGEGTFSEVLKAQSIKSGKAVAIKCMKNHFDSLDQVNNLREIQALHRLSPHPNIIRLMEVLYDGPTGRLALVFELMDMNVYELIRGRRHYVAEDRVMAYMYQLMKAMDHMHRNGIFHRDIKCVARAA